MKLNISRYTILTILLSQISCAQKSDLKYINSSKLCDSIRIEHVSENDYLLKLDNIKLPGIKQKSHYIFKFIDNNTEHTYDFLIKNDSLLYFNGIEYFLETTSHKYSLNQNWEERPCDDEGETMTNFSYEPSGKFIISNGPFQLALKTVRQDDNNFELYYDYLDSSIVYDNSDKIDKSRSVGSIKFLNNRMIKIDWEGLHYENSNKRFDLFIQAFEHKKSAYLLGT